MGTIFIGLLFACLNFNIDLGASRIGLLPDFIGYYLILKGIREMAEENEYFQKVMSLSKILMIYSAVMYVLDILTISSQLGIIGTILGIVKAVAALAVTYNLAMGIRQMEEQRQTELNGTALMTCWKVEAVATAVSWILLFAPALAVVAILAALIGNICYLYAFHKSRLAYEGLLR